MRSVERTGNLSSADDTDAILAEQIRRCRRAHREAGTAEFAGRADTRHGAATSRKLERWRRAIRATAN